MSDEIKNQIIELETKIQFQDDVIQKLDDELTQQNGLIDVITRRLSFLEDKVKDLTIERDSPATITEERPPHY